MKLERELRQNGMDATEQWQWLLSAADLAAEFLRIFRGITTGLSAEYRSQYP